MLIATDSSGELVSLRIEKVVPGHRPWLTFDDGTPRFRSIERRVLAEKVGRFGVPPGQVEQLRRRGVDVLHFTVGTRLRPPARVQSLRDDGPVIPCSDPCEVDQVDWESDEYQELSDQAFLTLVDSVATLVNFADDAVATLTSTIEDPYSDVPFSSDWPLMEGHARASDCAFVDSPPEHPEDPCAVERGAALGVKYAAIAAVGTCGVSAAATFLVKWSIKATIGFCATAYGTGLAAIVAHNDLKSCKNSHPEYYPQRPN